MNQQPTQEKTQIVPYLFCENVEANLQVLTDAFGMKVKQVHYGEDGRIKHAEAQLGNAVVMMGRASAEWKTASPRTLPALHAGILVYVDDVDTHFQQATRARATIISTPQNMPYGDRMYEARDFEGNFWYFATMQSNPITQAHTQINQTEANL